MNKSTEGFPVSIRFQYIARRFEGCHHRYVHVPLPPSFLRQRYSLHAFIRLYRVTGESRLIEKSKEFPECIVFDAITIRSCVSCTNTPFL